ncbi:MAG: MiaB/RimO family radical SAM methylthiotransferase [Caldiserica bacterium]|nr:MiaB/RimO family radical SAM methylthiotransferase [Caldisericota bacterium]
MKVFITTLGCKVNEVDSELYAQEMRLLGAETTTTMAEADAVVVNSCSVTNRAQAQSLQFARRALRERPGAPVYLTGCGATLLNLTRTEAPAGVAVVAMRDRAEVARLVVGTGGAMQVPARWVDGRILRAGPRNRVDVRIQEGCDNMCTYCLVPFVRGSRLESKSALVAVDEVMGLARAGVKEVVLTGTEIGKYGEAPDGLPILLDGMLGALETAGLPTRVRISSLNPDAITEALVGQFAKHAALCPQLHLPLQSGSDAVLQRMRRPYASKDLLAGVQRLRAVDPAFTFTTDVIVGFPGETEQDLQATLDMVRLAAFAKVHVFRYSRRPFTPAAREEHQIPAGVAKERLHRVLEVAEQTGMAFARRCVGRNVTIVSEKSSPGEVEGYSEHYLWTEGRTKDNEVLEPDSFVVVRIEGCRFDGDRVVLFGSVVA